MLGARRVRVIGQERRGREVGRIGARMNEKLEQLSKLAQARRVARVTYKRPGEPAPHDYVVEPYRLQRTTGGPAVHAWQLSPSPDGWRDFRLDRVTLVA